MSKITKMDTIFLNHMRNEIQEVLTSVGQANGMTLNIGNITYNATGFKTRIEAELGNPEDVERAAFEKATRSFSGDVTPDMYGMKFTNGRDTEEYTLVGLKPRSPKFPVRGRNAAGDTYKFKLSVITKEKQTPKRTLKFNKKKVRSVIDYTLANPIKEDGKKFWRTGPYSFSDRSEKPCLWLVADAGVYLMSPWSGSTKKDSPTIYAEGCNPKVDENCWERKNETWGGDDGCESFDIKEVERILETCNAYLCVGFRGEEIYLTSD